MRKALQAEQRKAEMLIRINQLSAACEDLEQTVFDLKEEIWQRLDNEKAGLQQQQRDHEDKKKEQTDENAQRRAEMRAKLLTTQAN